MNSIPAKHSIVTNSQNEKGRVIRRIGANHVKVKTEIVKSFQDFSTHKITESKCLVERVWKIVDLV